MVNKMDTDINDNWPERKSLLEGTLNVILRRKRMSKNWDYAELSKAAKAVGGPEKYEKMLELASKDAGRMEMLPWVGVAAVGASLLTATTIKVVNYFKSRKQKNREEIETAKQEIIKGIKDYDSEHENTVEEGENDQ